MWILSGPFDGETGDVSFQSKFRKTAHFRCKPTLTGPLPESKLLKTGTLYTLGRKDCALIIANKKVSSNHCDFEVKAFSGDDAGDPLKQPTLEFINTKDKGMRIARDGKQILINSRETRELKDGDVIAIISGVLVNVKWVPICCYVQPVMGKSPVSLSACASLGLHIVHVPDPRVTHHMVPSYSSQPILAASLLSASQFAKLEWLTEVLRLGTLPKGSKEPSLEENFELPPLSKFRPAYSPSLPTSQKEFRVWDPNEERLGMFSNYRFLYVDEKSRFGDYREVIERGGGSFEAFDATAGKSKFHRALTRGQAKEGKTQIVVGKAKSIIAAIGKESWEELVEEAKSFNLHILDPDVIVQVVIDVDTSLFHTPPSPVLDNDELPQSSSIPDFIPNTHSEEPSVPPPEPEQRTGPTRRLVRRATSRQASQEPSSIPTTKTPEPEPEAAPPRKALTRRVKTSGMPLVIGFDDPSMILDAVPDLSMATPAPPPSPPPQSVVDSVAPTPAPRSSRLKRRVGADGGASQALGFTLEEPSEEPPLKKFKALFEASGQDNVPGTGTFDGSTFNEHSQPIPESFSQTQNESQTQGGRSRSARSGIANLSTLREEEEETQGSVVTARGVKRGLEQIDEDVEMGDAREAPAGPILTKKRAIENVNAVEKAAATAAPTARTTSKPPSSAANKGSSAHKGALPGKPDQDAGFLKAIASTKKGKKTEDDFDRDFNKLKITKPVLEREEPEEQWALVADFGGDTNIRGNFMVVVEMQAYNRGQRETANDATTHDWQGKPNFKRFKKNRDIVRKGPIQLFVSSEEDSYLKGTGSQERRARDDFGLTQSKPNDQSEGSIQTLGKSQSPFVIDDSDEEMAPIRKGKSKISSRASSAAPPRRTSARSRAPVKSRPLFLEDDEDDDSIQAFNDNDAAEDSDDEQTLRSTLPRNTQRPPTRATSKKPLPILVDDDSDDDAVFKGFKGKQGRR